MVTDTKAALLDSAERAARRRGFDGFSYADLAQDVGIRKASIHHHFPTKAILAVMLMKRYHDTLQSICDQIDQTEPTGGARLSAMIERYRSALDGGKSLCLCVALSASRDSLPSEVATEMSSFRAMMMSWLRDVFTAGQTDGSIAHVSHPDAEAAAMLSLLEGAQLAARVEEAPELFQNAMHLIQKRLA